MGLSCLTTFVQRAYFVRSKRLLHSMRHDFGLGLYSHHSHKCIIFSFDNGRSPPLFASHLQDPKVEFEEYVRIRYFTEVSDLCTHGLKGQQHLAQGIALG